MLTKKNIIVILIIIVIILIILTLYLLYNKSNSNSNDINHTNKSNKVNNENILYYNKEKFDVANVPNAVVLSSHSNGVWTTCKMTPSNNPTWSSGAKWIGGSAAWVTWTPSANPGSYYFGKNITISDPSKISTAIFYVMIDDSGYMYLNNKQINVQKLGGGWGADGTGANAITIAREYFVSGTNKFIFNVTNGGTAQNPSGILAQLIINYNNGAASDTYITDGSWQFYNTSYPESMPSNTIVANVSEANRDYSSVFANEPKGTGHARSTLSSIQAWSSATNDANQWMKITLFSAASVSGIAISGRNASAWESQCVLTFYVDYIDSSGATSRVDNGMLYYSRLKGDPKQVVYISFLNPIIAKTIVIKPVTWNIHISMRADILLTQTPFIGVSGATSINMKNDNATDFYMNGTNSGRYLQISQLAVYTMINGVETNIATKGTATASSFAGNHPPNVAIDGVLRAKNYATEKGFHSAGNSPEWWNLVLDKPYNIHKIVYYNRADCCQIRAKGVELRVFNNNSTTTPIYTTILNEDLIQTIEAPTPNPKLIFKFDSNNLSNITFYNTATNAQVNAPQRETDTNNFKYINFNNTIHGVNSNPLLEADNRNITIECVFKYKGKTGSILNNIGQNKNNVRLYNDSFIEVANVNGIDSLLVGMFPMHQTSQNINLGQVTSDTWYQVILKGSTTSISGSLNSVVQSNISFGNVYTVPSNPKDANLPYYLSFGAPMIANTLTGGPTGTGNGFTGYISYINVYSGNFNVNPIQFIKDTIQIIPNNIYQLKSIGSNKCIYNNKDGFGTVNCAENNDQNWKFIKKDNNIFQLKNMNTNNCLYNNSDGRFSIGTCNIDYNDQTWQFMPKDNNIFNIKNINSNKCLYNNIDGRFNTYNCEDYNDQNWELIDKTSPEGPILNQRTAIAIKTSPNINLAPLNIPKLQPGATEFIGDDAPTGLDYSTNPTITLASGDNMREKNSDNLLLQVSELNSGIASSLGVAGGNLDNTNLNIVKAIQSSG